MKRNRVLVGALCLCFVRSFAWQPIQLIRSDKPYKEFFGASVARSGDYLVVGAFGEKTGGNYAGAAHVYRFVDGYHVYETTLKAEDANKKDRFGISVAIYGTTVVVGA
jgi:hypothetical protein